MRRKRAVKLFIICIICVGILIGRKAYMEYAAMKVPIPYTDRIMGIAILDNTEFLQSKERKIVEKNPGICFEEVLLPFDKGLETLYLSQSLENEKWIGKISLQGREGFLCAPRDDFWEDKQAAIKENHMFTIWLVEENAYYEFQLAISGMPVICMETEREEEREPIDWDDSELDPDIKWFSTETFYYGTISVFDPDRRQDYSNYRIHESKVRYYLKGASSLGLVKKGYSLSLQDYKGNNIDASLLGMRSDNCWKLNALYTDVNRIREMTASQLWEKFEEANTEAEESGPRMKYIELILDNEYQGLYCLVEPIDEKKLGLDRNDILYKSISWDRPATGDIMESIEKGWKIQKALRIRYPEKITDYMAAWYPMFDYIDRFYQADELDYAGALERVRVSNLSDMTMFTMVTSASDNVWKNTYFAANVAADNSYVMRQIPWDLDYTFGNIYNYDDMLHVRFDENYHYVYTDEALAKLKRANREEIGKPFYERWQAYRADFLSTENILQMLQDNRQHIIETGAVAREMQRWPDAQVSMDINYLLDFQVQRMEWLDEYFEQWALASEW